MTRSLLVPLLWVFLSHPLHAGSVEFAQWLPWNFISQELRKNELILNVAESEIILSLGELRPVLSGVSFSSRTMVRDFKHEAGSLSISGTGAMSVLLESFSINQIVTREFGGNVIQIHLKAECSGSRVEVSSFGIHSFFSIHRSGGYLPELTDLALDILPADWKVGAINCTGLGGIGEEIEKSINQAMKDPGQLAMLVRDWMKPYFDQWIKNQWLSVSNFNEGWENLSISSPGENGFYLRGEIPLQSEEDIVLNNVLPADPALTFPRFYLSREGWSAIAEDRLRSLLPKFYDLRQNNSFRKLMQSKFAQFFVWPHLRKFHSSTPFVLRTDTSSLDLAMSESQGQWKAELKGNGALTTLVGGSPIDYIVFEMKLNCPLRMEVEGGSLVIRNGKATVSLDWKFGYLYQLLYSPDKKVPVQIMAGALADLIGEKTMRLELPHFRIADTEYVLGNLRMEDQLLTMDWL